MIVNKITIGYVVQTFDTSTKKCIKQEFVAGDQVDWETGEGEPVHIKDMDNLYFPFEMTQPN